MGEVKKIIVEHYPVENLPEELRRGIERGLLVRITVEAEVTAEPAPRRRLSSWVGSGQGVYSSPEEAVAAIRELREEWP